ncbi:methyl-accepting chemotaxis protein [Massilia putida]|uniref:methyl-accepting chemotaxis protein n=1 Tax=Massilia putida TaxID=1141883 RepID=UPI0012EB5A1A|nr:methyl-accepting chemotaxis protein [Massilia putida]
MRVLRSLATRVARAFGTPAAPPDYGAAVAASLRLDHEVGVKLNDAVGRTEASALAIMEQVRGLCDRSAALSVRLHDASAQADAFETDAQAHTGDLVAMADFLARLPERLERDRASIRRIEAEIRGLSDLAASVQGISIQSHMLSINAAIEASRAGQHGQSFKVVAEEMRALAANSHGAAARIGKSLGAIRGMLSEGLQRNAERSSEDVARIAETAEAVSRLQGSFERVRGTYRAGFAEMLAHGEALSAGTAEVLGQLQYQDVVRQCVERLRQAVDRRNGVLEREMATALPAPDRLAALIGDIVEDYLAAESLHGGGADESGMQMIELF